MFTELTYIPQAWKKAWKSKTFRNHLLFSIVFVALSCVYNFHYLKVWQLRQGTALNDVILNHLPPFDFSTPIFVLEYSALVLVFIFILPYPDKMIRGMQMFAVILFVRTTTIYLVPLEPPKDMIPLFDPVANVLLHTPSIFVTRDLFFSGHVSALTLLYLISTNRYVKLYNLLATIAVSVFIVWQHVHYSLDVIFAPVAGYLTYRLVEWTHTQTKLGTELQNAK